MILMCIIPSTIDQLSPSLFFYGVKRRENDTCMEIYLSRFYSNQRFWRKASFCDGQWHLPMLRELSLTVMSEYLNEWTWILLLSWRVKLLLHLVWPLSVWTMPMLVIPQKNTLNSTAKFVSEKSANSEGGEAWILEALGRTSKRRIQGVIACGFDTDMSCEKADNFIISDSKEM